MTKTTTDPLSVMDLFLLSEMDKTAAPYAQTSSAVTPAVTDDNLNHPLQVREQNHQNLEQSSAASAAGWKKTEPWIGWGVNTAARSLSPYVPPVWGFDPTYLETEIGQQKTKAHGKPFNPNMQLNPAALALSAGVGNTGGDMVVDRLVTDRVAAPIANRFLGRDTLKGALKYAPKGSVARAALGTASKAIPQAGHLVGRMGVVGLAGELLDTVGMAPGFTGGKGVGATGGTEISKTLDVDTGLAGRSQVSYDALQNRLKSFNFKDVPELRLKYDESRKAIQYATNQVAQFEKAGYPDQAAAWKQTALNRREEALNYLGLLNDFEPFLSSSYNGSVGAYGDTSKQQFHKALDVSGRNSTAFGFANEALKNTLGVDISANNPGIEGNAAALQAFKQRISSGELQEDAIRSYKDPKDPEFLKDVQRTLLEEQAMAAAYKEANPDLDDNIREVDMRIGQMLQGDLSSDEAQNLALAATDSSVPIELRERIAEGLQRYHGANRAYLTRSQQSVDGGMLSTAMGVPLTARYMFYAKPFNTINAGVDTVRDVFDPTRSGSMLNDVMGGGGLLGQLAPGHKLEDNTIGKNFSNTARLLAAQDRVGLGNSEKGDEVLRTVGQVKNDNIKAKNVGMNLGEQLKQRFAQGYYQGPQSGFPQADLRLVNRILQSGTWDQIQASEKDLRSKLGQLELTDPLGEEYAKTRDTWAALYGAIGSKTNYDRIASGEINRQNFETPEGALKGLAEVPSQALAYGLSDRQVAQNLQRLQHGIAKAEQTNPQLALRLKRSADQLEQLLKARREYAAQYFNSGTPASAPHPYAADPESQLSLDELSQKLKEFGVTENTSIPSKHYGALTPEGYKHRLLMLWKLKKSQEAEARK